MQHTSIFSTGAHVDNLEIIQHLGSGAYGQVYLGHDHQKQQNYAIKTLLRHTNSRKSEASNNNNEMTAAHRQRGFQRMEIGLHARLSGHPHIVQLDRVIRQTNYTHLVMEYAPEGDLFTAITERDLFAGNHPLIRRVFLQLLDAVEHCHLNGVYHRDLKSENILVFDGGRTIKLTDFGLATLDPISTDYGCGSTFYFSPECLGDLDKQRQQRVGYATAPNDIWALGVILINLAAGRNPWKQASLQDETFRAYLTDPNFLLKILPISRELNRILKRIFCIDPLRRIGLKELAYRIQQCKYFTRTAEVDRWEKLQDFTFINNCNRTYLYNSSNNNGSNRDITNTFADTTHYTPNPTTRPTTPSSSSSASHFNTAPQTLTTTTPAAIVHDVDSMTTVPVATHGGHYTSIPGKAVDMPPTPPATPRDVSQQSYNMEDDICINNSSVDASSSSSAAGNPTVLLPASAPLVV
ncbi:kinase-like domain-containing protein [Absidia repens]|uniref:Kinase-like domain-containing protein n=1 Tax=Absidia repens TaxID=90262 RepID=A0A1X2IPM4_9FUNG|nr:kinase-like domain-containing protein [Absidia repens]